MMLIILGLLSLIGGLSMGVSIVYDYVSEKIDAEIIKNHVEHSMSSRGAKRKEYYADIKYIYEGQVCTDRIYQKSRKKAGETILICRRKNSISEYYPLKDLGIFAITMVIGLITLAFLLNI